jgi:hypothetical protein
LPAREFRHSLFEIDVEALESNDRRFDVEHRIERASDVNGVAHATTGGYRTVLSDVGDSSERLQGSGSQVVEEENGTCRRGE